MILRAGICIEVDDEEEGLEILENYLMDQLQIDIEKYCNRSIRVEDCWLDLDEDDNP